MFASHWRFIRHSVARLGSCQWWLELGLGVDLQEKRGYRSHSSHPTATRVSDDGRRRQWSENLSAIDGKPYIARMIPRLACGKLALHGLRHRGIVAMENAGTWADSWVEFLGLLRMHHHVGPANAQGLCSPCEALFKSHPTYDSYRTQRGPRGRRPCAERDR